MGRRPTTTMFKRIIEFGRVNMLDCIGVYDVRSSWHCQAHDIIRKQHFEYVVRKSRFMFICFFRFSKSWRICFSTLLWASASAMQYDAFYGVQEQRVKTDARQIKIFFYLFVYSKRTDKAFTLIYCNLFK